MISTKKLFILFFSSFLCATTSSWCKDGLQIKGKLRILKPTTLQVNDLNGTLILSCELQPNKEFTTEQKLIQPDIYTLRIGKTEEKIWLLRSEAEGYHGCGRHDFHSGSDRPPVSSCRSDRIYYVHGTQDANGCIQLK